MMHLDRAIARLIRTYAASRAISESYASRLASGSGDTLHRIDTGASLTTRRAGRIIQWLFDHWPADLEWPSDIPRPTPRAEDEAA